MRGNFTKKDLTNKRFGHLVALEPTDERYYRHVVWLCKCDCGNLTKATARSLQDGNRTSCGCARQAVKDNWSETLKRLRKENDWDIHKPKKKRKYKAVEEVANRREDLTGKCFKNWTALYIDSTSEKSKWICKCNKCGALRSILTCSLKKGYVICKECKKGI